MIRQRITDKKQLRKLSYGGITGIISVSAYKVDGTDISSTMMTINTTNNKNYLNQTAWSKYVSNYNAGKVDSTVQPLTFSSTSGSNVIYKV